MIFPQTLIFRVHAIKRMLERDIAVEDVKQVLLDPKILKEYVDDRPYPSYLVLGWKDRRPIHLVVALNNEANETIIVTAYEPSIVEWNEGFNTRKAKE
ncbi:MAG: DUF4258 domain-containing protein [Verrucomicrobia bacterium]|nr:DUF4258 domain-containing protein [Verrucomicrobiota bacterium]